MTDAKRVLDVAVAAPMLVVTAPVQAAVAVAVAARLGRPVLFRQQRPGRDGRPFTILKFRTMLPVDAAAGPGRRRVPDDRAGPVPARHEPRRAADAGQRAARRHVARRAAAVADAYLPRYSATQARRHEVRPGLTGLAQVSGRNAVGWDQRLALDVEYVDTRTMWLDLAILLRTVRAVLRRDGISADGEATMPEFLGSRRAA